MNTPVSLSCSCTAPPPYPAPLGGPPRQMMDVTGKVQAAAGSPGPADGLFITVGLQLSFKGPKMPQSRAVRDLNTFIVMDAAAKAPQELQVSTLLLLPR